MRSDNFDITELGRHHMTINRVTVIAYQSKQTFCAVLLIMYVTQENHSVLQIAPALLPQKQ